MSDIIKLNVGGFRYETTLDTLERDPESMLASMFSGRHKLVSGEDGYHFIDRNGEVFKYILKYLRDGKINLDDMSIHLMNDLLDEAEYYCINGLVTLITTYPRYFTLQTQIEAEITRVLETSKTDYQKKLKIKQAQYQSLIEHNQRKKEEHKKVEDDFKFVNDKVKNLEELTEQHIGSINILEKAILDKKDEIETMVEKNQKLKDEFALKQVSLVENLEKSLDECHQNFYQAKNFLENMSRIVKFQIKFEPDNCTLEKDIDYNFYRNYFKNWSLEEFLMMYNLWYNLVKKNNIKDYTTIGLLFFVPCFPFYQNGKQFLENHYSLNSKILIDFSSKCNQCNSQSFNNHYYSNPNQNITINGLVDNFKTYIEKHQSTTLDEIILSIKKYYPQENEIHSILELFSTYFNDLFKKPQQQFGCSQLLNHSYIIPLKSFINFNDINEFINFDVKTITEEQLFDKIYLESAKLRLQSSETQKKELEIEITRYQNQNNPNYKTQIESNKSRMKTLEENTIPKNIESIKSLEKQILEKSGKEYSDMKCKFDFYQEKIPILQRFIKRNNFKLTLLDTLYARYGIDYVVEEKMNNYHYIKKNYPTLSRNELFRKIYKIFPFDDVVCDFLDFIFTLDCSYICKNEKNEYSLYLDGRYYNFSQGSQYFIENIRGYKDLNKKYENIYYNQNCEFILKYLQESLL